MEVVRDLDLKWFWIGYTAGANSRKKIVQSQNKIMNLGKQGIKTVLTNKQKISFFIGVKTGRGKLVQNFNIIRRVQFQDRDAHKNRGDYLTAEVGSIETPAGSTFTIPFLISNNSVENRGYIGYQYKIKYPKQYLTLQSVNPSPTWQGSFKYEHDAVSGIVFIQGLNDLVLSKS